AITGINSSMSSPVVLSCLYSPLLAKQVPTALINNSSEYVKPLYTTACPKVETPVRIESTGLKYPLSSLLMLRV
ncbi:MAG: hypothetical protein QXF73_06500, partial [Desulfurococcaceae archaeon]